MGMWLNVLLGQAGVFVGYLLGAAGGGALVHFFSENTHDRAHEAATTGIFVTGPVGALVGLLAGCSVPFVWR
jgi:hypothetical protein